MFHKNEETEIEKFDKEIELLTPEEAKLSRECELLHGKAMAEDFVPEKSKIMAEKAELYAKLNHIQNTIRSLREQQAIPKLAHLLKSNRQTIKVEVNRSRIEIPENLDVNIHFEGCSHALKMPVYELIRYQTTMDTNTKLLNAWEIALREGSTLTKMVLCVECMKAKKKMAEERHMTQPTRQTGTANIQIVIFK